MTLADTVTVARRFQRSVRIDTDLGDPAALEGFICPPSAANVLREMTRHIVETGHCAFTWTGPYGSGKSSLAVAFSALLNGNTELRGEAANVFGDSTARELHAALPPKADGWHILPVVGRRDRPEQVIGEALVDSSLVRGKRRRRVWRERQTIDALLDLAQRNPDTSGGLIVLIDEMGKFLEGAAHGIADVYFFQQLAEMASRSERRLLLIGVLHQAFEEYAYRLSRDAQDEWSKIQGRFLDLAVNTAVDEQLSLLGRAIDNGRPSVEPNVLSRTVAELTLPPKSPELPTLLEQCLPLHPVVSCLLGPISRRRFGQNQRSVFGFLNSTEPYGFQDFLRKSSEGQLYLPHVLWDYLRFNLEPSIMASPDGHRWAVAVDALERCLTMGGQTTHTQVLQSIAVVDLFKERAGLTPNQALLQCCLPEIPVEEVREALLQLQAWSLIIYRKLTDSYSVFEGSDFDIDAAVQRHLDAMPEVDISRLSALADLQPIVAKKHYHETGALRWFDVALAPAADVKAVPEKFAPRTGAVGTFVLMVPTQGETPDELQAIASHSMSGDRGWDLVVGELRDRWDLSSLAKELIAIEQVREQSPELLGDRVARREVEARISTLRGYIEGELSRAFNNAVWHAHKRRATQLNFAALNGLASELADRRYPQSPKIHNELLNRVRPSSNAVAAQNVLLRRMAQYEGKPRLGIEGFPAEGGLFESLLHTTGLYRETEEGWRFARPLQPDVDPCGLGAVWDVAEEVLRSNSERAVAAKEVYDLWCSPPFGIKEGLLPLLMAAFILSHHRQVAMYRETIFQARVSDLDMEVLTRDPRDVQLRWMDLSENSRALLSDMAGIVRTLDSDNALQNLEPIDVAKGLVAIHDALPAWVGRTQYLSANAKRVRQLFKQASDPNRLIFDDIPRLLSGQPQVAADGDGSGVVGIVREGLAELQAAYPSMLRQLKNTLLAELQVPNDSPPSLAELRARAENVRELGGDLRMGAFVLRLAKFEGTDVDIESLASMAANKPLEACVDADIEHATIELAEMAQRFMRNEAFAHVKGRHNRRHAMSVTVGIGGRPTTVTDEFAVTTSERSDVERLIKKMRKALQSSASPQRNVVLAALAELTAQYIDDYDKSAENGIHDMAEELSNDRI